MRPAPSWVMADRLLGSRTGTSSLSGIFAGCVHAAGARDGQLIRLIELTVVDRSVPDVPALCGTWVARPKSNRSRPAAELWHRVRSSNSRRPGARQAAPPQGLMDRPPPGRVEAGTSGRPHGPTGTG